ncbi:hypothetical protein LZ30DRAFT_353920 [Colletotrichum cereale]|nr:hypothetical protein LZ30DRAFT_353920 [Colletotrichum cereale]
MCEYWNNTGNKGPGENRRWISRQGSVGTLVSIGRLRRHRRLRVHHTVGKQRRQAAAKKPRGKGGSPTNHNPPRTEIHLDMFVFIRRASADRSTSPYPPSQMKGSPRSRSGENQDHRRGGDASEIVRLLETASRRAVGDNLKCLQGVRSWAPPV